MFKNLILYRIADSWQADFQTLHAALEKAVFQPCTATQALATGWVAPRGQAHGALLESVAGQWILRFHSESKLLPASVVQRRVDERCAAILHSEGRQPGKKERRDMQEEARLDLLPQAFTQHSSIWVWIDPQARWLVLDTSAQTKADAVVSLLVEHLAGFSLALLDTAISAPAAMAQWLVEQAAPSGFAIGQECELKACDGSKAVVRYAHHSLDIEEVRQHIQQGKQPSKLALTWQDRVGCVLTESLQLKKITFLDTVLDEAEASSAGKDDGGFDADVTIATGELSQLLPDLLQALGGLGRSPSASDSSTSPASGAATRTTGPAQAPADSEPDAAPF